MGLGQAIKCPREYEVYSFERGWTHYRWVGGVGWSRCNVNIRYIRVGVDTWVVLVEYLLSMAWVVCGGYRPLPYFLSMYS